MVHAPSSHVRSARRQRAIQRGYLRLPSRAPHHGSHADQISSAPSSLGNAGHHSISTKRVAAWADADLDDSSPPRRPDPASSNCAQCAASFAPSSAASPLCDATDFPSRFDSQVSSAPCCADSPTLLFFIQRIYALEFQILQMASYSPATIPHTDALHPWFYGAQTSGTPGGPDVSDTLESKAAAEGETQPKDDTADGRQIPVYDIATPHDADGQCKQGVLACGQNADLLCGPVVHGAVSLSNICAGAGRPVLAHQCVSDTWRPSIREGSLDVSGHHCSAPLAGVFAGFNLEAGSFAVVYGKRCAPKHSCHGPSYDVKSEVTFLIEAARSSVMRAGSFTEDVAHGGVREPSHGKMDMQVDPKQVHEAIASYAKLHEAEMARLARHCETVFSQLKADEYKMLESCKEMEQNCMCLESRLVDKLNLMAKEIDEQKTPAKRLLSITAKVDSFEKRMSELEALPGTSASHKGDKIALDFELEERFKQSEKETLLTLQKLLNDVLAQSTNKIMEKFATTIQAVDDAVRRDFQLSIRESDEGVV